MGIVGHAIRLVAVVSLVAGLALLGWWGAGRLAPRMLIAEFERAETAAGESEQRFVQFSGDDAAPDADLLRIELSQVAPCLECSLHDRLSVSDGADETFHDLVPGTAIPVSGESYRVAGVRTWQGLFATTDGAPMASVTVFKDDTVLAENLVLRPATRFDFDTGFSLEMRTCPGRETALAEFDAAVRQANRGEWGVLHDGQWVFFSGLTPGTGTTFADGTIVSVDSYSPEGPTLVLRQRTPDGDELIEVNGPSNGPPVYFDPGEAPHAALMVVCEDGRAIVGGVGPAELDVAEMWVSPDGHHAIRIEQALVSAVPVEATDSPLFEAVLESDSRRLRVRQGEAIRVGEVLLRYVRAPGNATASIAMRAYLPGRGAIPVDLRPGERFLFAWAGERWSLAHADIDPDGNVTIRREPRGRALPVAASIVVVLSGILLWLGRRRAAR